MQITKKIKTYNIKYQLLTTYNLQVELIGRGSETSSE